MTTMLAPGQIHIHVLDLDQTESVVDARFEFLSEDEIERAESFAFEHLKRRFVLCRGGLRQKLGQYLLCDPNKLHFAYTEKEKPYLDRPSSADKQLCFNVSHSADLAIIACAWNRELGVDVEQMQRKTDMEGIARRYFSDLEFKAYQGASEGEREEVFYNCWTGKEAFIKAKGKGLSIELASFAVEARPSHPPRLLKVDWDAKETRHWTLYRFRPQEDFIATLAYQSGDVEIVHVK